ncbi:MAG: hypothetical protein COZ56_13235 [Armatimonadetes bacterium CG_4_8_14_3_um_filter_58_9]|nr:MAG: hypothetical protein COZ56_13235 [Armatimonadetes bacterium CG_4_8_14_3_um_filter_58_9]
MMTVTPKERVQMTLCGEFADKVPFTIYESKLPQCSVERQLRNEGLCIVDRRHPVVWSRTPNVQTETVSYVDDGIAFTKLIYRTPLGDLETIYRPAGFTSWCTKKVFTRPEDYKPLLFLIQDERHVPCYDSFMKAEQEAGEDKILRGGVGSTPLHQIMIGWMGVETFAIEWADRRDEVMKLYDAHVENLRKIYPLLADSPCWSFNFGGNETADVMGKQRFEQYVVPHYCEAAEVLHKKGKLLGTHLDGNNKVWAQAVADSPLDYVEAFTPAPDCDMTFLEAREIWKDKVLWINFTSSVHVAPLEKVKEETRRLLRESAPGVRFIIGITEDVPENRWQENLLAISRVIEEEGRLPISG